MALATRWRLLVDSKAWLYAPAPIAVSRRAPVSAVTTLSGLPLRFPIDDAPCIAVDPSTNPREATEKVGCRRVGTRLVLGAWRETAV